LQLDQAFENIINTLFYILMFWIIIGIAGANPKLLWGTAISFMITFKFMIGTGCSDYFTGIMMVLCQRPYDIGDRIATSYPYLDTSMTGSSTWVVKDVNLYSTTVMYGSTNEVATHSNGALSTLRIINGTRSPQASLRFDLKFPVETPFSKIQVFKNAMEKFVRARKREVCGTLF
jgi:small-conductance mechanosensitive channel